MTQVILQPAGGKDARVHFDDTIRTAVPLTQMADLLSPSELSRLEEQFPDGAAAAWGVVPGESGRNEAGWNEIVSGAVILFGGTGAIRATGVVVNKLHNKALAERLWGHDEDGDTWEFMYFIDQIEACEIPYPAFNAAAGYKVNYVIQRFQVLGDPKASNVLDALDLRSDHTIPGSREDFEAAVALPDGIELDAEGRVLIRKEQGFVRRRLFGRRETAPCSLCGRTLPVDLLIAAHIKRRSLCSQNERRDYANNVTPMCRLGCDSLFELGYIVIREGSVIANSQRGRAVSPALIQVLESLVGRTCPGWTEGSAAYFKSHAQLHSNV